MNSIESILKGKTSILAIVAHPDDLEDYFSGMFMYAVEKGITKPEYWHLVVCTDGGKGSRDNDIDSHTLVKRRIKEQKQSLSTLGIPIANYTHFDFEDGYINNYDNTLIEHIAFQIRKTKPDILLTHNGLDTIVARKDGYYYIHKDHRVVGKAVLDAMYPYSRDLLFFPHHNKKGYCGHIVRDVLIAESATPDIKVDITPYLEQKIALNHVFASQVDSDEHIRTYMKNTQMEKDGRYYEQFKHVHIVV